MADSQKYFSKDLVKIISNAVEKKIYGSIEVYFEAGSVTQITQRIISKVRTKSPDLGQSVKKKTA